MAERQARYNAANQPKGSSQDGREDEAKVYREL